MTMNAVCLRAAKIFFTTKIFRDTAQTFRDTAKISQETFPKETQTKK